MLCQHSCSNAYFIRVCWHDNFPLTLILNGNHFHLTNGKGLCEVTTSIHLCVRMCALYYWAAQRFSDFGIFITAKWIFPTSFTQCGNPHVAVECCHCYSCIIGSALHLKTHMYMYMHTQMQCGENNCIKEQNTKSHLQSPYKWDARKREGERMIMIWLG